jgi:hypothetical protein
MIPVVAMTQALLVAAGAPISVDGIKGPATSRALKSNPLVEQMIPALTTMVKAVSEKSTDEQWIDHETLTSYCQEAALATGLRAQTLLWIVSLEANRRESRGVVYYDAKSISKTGHHKGLGQLYAGAWKDAERYRARHDAATPLGPFALNWSNPRKSVFAMAYYLKASEGYAKAIMPSLIMTDELRYAIYNQGAGFVTKTLRGDVVLLGKQSPMANNIAMSARKQVLENAKNIV